MHIGNQFLSDAVSHYDRLLILGDFNIHLCCPVKPVVKDFFTSSRMPEFCAVRLWSYPHTSGHTLDLVTPSGLSVTDLEVVDSAISDHHSVVFESVRFRQSLNISRVIHASSDYSIWLYTLQMLLRMIWIPWSWLKFLTLTVDTIAPGELKGKDTLQPWLNDCTRALRQECRTMERK